MQPGTLRLSADDLVGIASSLSQLTRFQAVVQGPDGPIEPDVEQLVSAVAEHDAVLGALVRRWAEMGCALRDHVTARVRAPEPAAPFRVSACGHAL